MKLQPQDIDEEFHLFDNKINTFLYVERNIRDLKSKEYFDILNKILLSKLEWNNYRFIKELFANEIMKNNPDKRNVALDVALKDKVSIETGVNDCYLYPFVWSVLTNKEVLSFDNKTYKKVVQMSIVKMQSYLLDVAMKKENLTTNQKAYIIDYYNYVLKKYRTKLYGDCMNWIKEYSELSIIDVVYSDRLVAMDEMQYKKTLKDIMNCNKPFSYIKVLKATNINEEKRNIALQMIEQGPNITKEFVFLRDLEDYKELVAKVAVSPLLANMPIDEYKKFLLLQNGYCEKTEILFQKRASHDEAVLQANIRNAISSFLSNGVLFSQNMPRLLKSINEVISADNGYLVQMLQAFCNHNNSAYYTDTEYERILEIIKKSKVDCLLVISLFTNKNVPFMIDKNILFETAMTGDKNKINKLTETLNRQGYFNINMYYILNGVSTESIEQIGNTEDVNVKRLIGAYYK